MMSRQLKRSFLVIVTLLIFIGFLPGYALGDYSSDFETDDGGWTESGFGDWERGTIVTGVYQGCDTSPRPEPTGAHSGVNVWATNLDGCYTNSNSDNILSQTFDFSAYSAPIELSWWHWYEVFETFDYAIVQVNGTQVWRTPNSTASPDWIHQTVDLSAYAGNPSVTITFLLHATTVVNRSGWYLDDISISKPNVAPVADAGRDQTVGVGETVTLTGSGSDAESSPLTYGWTQNSGPAVTFTPNISVTTFTAPGSAAVLTFTLTVTDTGGLTGTDQTVVTVIPNYALTVNTAGAGSGTVATYANGALVLPPDRSFPPGTVVTLTAAAAPASTFAGWSGALSGTVNPITTTMDANKVITATFNTNSDLAVSKNWAREGITVTYTLVALNPGPNAADGAVVSDTFPADMYGVTWTCVAAGGAACTAGGVGNLQDTLTSFPAGGVVTYTVAGAVPMFFTASNTVAITPPAGVSDPLLSNNTATVYLYSYLLLPIYKNASP